MFFACSLSLPHTHPLVVGRWSSCSLSSLLACARLFWSSSKPAAWDVDLDVIVDVVPWSFVFIADIRGGDFAYNDMPVTQSVFYCLRLSFVASSGSFSPRSSFFRFLSFNFHRLRQCLFNIQLVLIPCCPHPPFRSCPILPLPIVHLAETSTPLLHTFIPTLDTHIRSRHTPTSQLRPSSTH